jgi:hypothetical protein
MNAARARHIRPFRRPALKLYHGGVPGLVPGQMLEPPALTGAPSCSDHGRTHCRSDRVFVTSDPEEAAVYAALASRGGRGDVYEVEPCGELEPEAPGKTGAGSYAVPAATVTAVVRRAISRQEAVAQMTAFLVNAGSTTARSAEARKGCVPAPPSVTRRSGVDVEERTELK